MGKTFFQMSTLGDISFRRPPPLFAYTIFTVLALVGLNVVTATG